MRPQRPFVSTQADSSQLLLQCYIIVKRRQESLPYGWVSELEGGRLEAFYIGLSVGSTSADRFRHFPSRPEVGRTRLEKDPGKTVLPVVEMKAGHPLDGRRGSAAPDETLERGVV